MMTEAFKCQHASANESKVTHHRRPKQKEAESGNFGVSTVRAREPAG